MFQVVLRRASHKVSQRLAPCLFHFTSLWIWDIAGFSLQLQDFSFTEFVAATFNRKKCLTEKVGRVIFNSVLAVNFFEENKASQGFIHTVAFELPCFLHLKRTSRAREPRFRQKHGWEHTTECLGSELRRIRRGISHLRDRIRDWSKSAWYSLRLPKWSRQNQLTCDNCFHCFVTSANWGELAEGEVSHASRHFAENSCRKHKLTLIASVAPSIKIYCWTVSDSCSVVLVLIS